MERLLELLAKTLGLLIAYAFVWFAWTHLYTGDLVGMVLLGGLAFGVLCATITAIAGE